MAVNLGRTPGMEKKEVVKSNASLENLKRYTCYNIIGPHHPSLLSIRCRFFHIHTSTS